jgi:hypothetical protein
MTRHNNHLKYPTDPTYAEIEGLVCAFETCVLPPAEWNHRAHLLMALFYLYHHNEAYAVELMRQGIRRYRKHSYLLRGEEQPAGGGYHETITLFYVKVLRRYLTAVPAGTPLENIARDVVQDCGSKDFVLNFYTAKRLFSERARLEWIEPDLQCIDSYGLPSMHTEE